MDTAKTNPTSDALEQLKKQLKAEAQSRIAEASLRLGTYALVRTLAKLLITKGVLTKESINAMFEIVLDEHIEEAKPQINKRILDSERSLDSDDFKALDAGYIALRKAALAIGLIE